MRRLTRTKIVSTVGPATSSEERLAQLFEAGVDVFRINFSHGTHADHEQRVRVIRSLEERTGRPIGILADMQGPKLRVGAFAGGRIELAAGAAFRLDLRDDAGGDEAGGLPGLEDSVGCADDRETIGVGGMDVPEELDGAGLRYAFGESCADAEGGAEDDVRGLAAGLDDAESGAFATAPAPVCGWR